MVYSDLIHLAIAYAPTVKYLVIWALIAYMRSRSASQRG